MIRSYLVRGSAMALLGALLVVAAGDRALAVKVPVDLPASLWSTTGVVKLAGAGIGSEKGVIDALVGFGPQPGLDVGEFGIVLDPGGADILALGTFTELKPGKPVILVDQAPLQAQFEALLPGVDVTMRKTTAKVTAKNKKGIETIRAFFKSQFQGCFVDDRGRPVCKNFTVQYKGEGGRATP